jgi:hypothetical protein
MDIWVTITVMNMSITHPNRNSHASLLQLNFSKCCMNIILIFKIMNPLCCNKNSGVSLSDPEISKLWHEFRKFIFQPLQHQLAHIIEIIYTKEVLLQYKSIKVLDPCWSQAEVFQWLGVVHWCVHNCMIPSCECNSRPSPNCCSMK